jgi:hypothetical protein
MALVDMTMARTRLLAMFLVVSAYVLGCGDGMPGAGGVQGVTCASNASCGGNIIGTWSIAQTCNLKTTMPTTCTEETYAVSDQAQTGTLDFRADGTVAETLRSTGTIMDLLPPACLTNGETCADVDATFRNLVTTGSIYTSASCADSAGTCKCTLMFETNSTTSATYATSGSTFTVTSNGDASTGTYCVTGSALVISLSTTSGEPPATYVLARQ